MTAATTAVLETLRSEVAGKVLTPGDHDYAVETGGFDLALVHTAPIVVAAANSDDVVRTVGIAASAGLSITVIGGGHGDIPAATEGILLTTRHLGEVHLDIASKTARVGSGATWHDVMDVVTPVGLAPLVGSAPAVGETLAPVAGRAAYYRGRREEYPRLYEAVVG